MTILVALCGFGAGAGILLIARGLFPRRLTLAAALANLSVVPAPVPGITRPGQRAARRLAGHALETTVARTPGLAERIDPDLAITGTAPEALAVRAVGSALGLALLAALAAVDAPLAGLAFPPEVTVIGVLVAALCGLVLPFFDLRKAGVARRRQFSHSLASYVNLVVMSMSSSMGWSSALQESASLPSADWAIREIAQCLVWADAYGRPPWEGLQRLATRFGVEDLSDLARAMSQAGDGVRVKETLQAKAAAMQLTEAAAIEDAAEATTQRMTLPGLALVVAYTLLLFFPAVASFATAKF